MNLETVPNAPASRGYSRLTFAHLRALDHALLHENLVAARHAFAQLQDDAPDLAEIVRTTPQSNDSHRRVLLKQFAAALREGKVVAAQLAFLQFQDAATTDSSQPFPGSISPTRPVNPQTGFISFPAV